MAVLGEQEAILFTVPRGYQVAEIGGTEVVATGAASSGATAILGAVTTSGFIGTSGFWYTWVASEDCHIRVGGSNVAPCTTNDWPMFKGQEMNRWVRINIDTHFTVIQDVSAGKVYHGRTNQ